MATSFKEAVATQKAEAVLYANRVKAMRELAKIHKVEKLFNTLQAAEAKCTMYMGSYSVGITVPVISMKHMLEVLEIAEAITGIELDSNYENAASGQRIFQSSDYTKSWLSIIAQVAVLADDDTALCRRIKTGVRTIEQDVYELECLG
jgi:hypothetical protein